MLPHPHISPHVSHGLACLLSVVLGCCSGYPARGAAPQLPPAHGSLEQGRAVEVQAGAKVYPHGSRGRV